MDVEASRAIRQAEVGASKTMIERTQERFDIKPERLAGDTGYGSGANLNWLVKDKDIAPHIPVIDKSNARTEPLVGRTSRSTRTVTCTSARRTRSSRRRASWSTTGRHFSIGKSARLSWSPAQGTMLSKDVGPQNPAQYLRGSSRRCPGAGQDGGVQAIIARQEACRNAVCALEAYLAARPAAIARAMRCPVRVHVGSDCAEPPQACQLFARPPPFAPLCAA